MTLVIIEPGDGTCEANQHHASLVDEHSPKTYRCDRCNAIWRKRLRRVVLESPYGSKDAAVVTRNTLYARKAMLHALRHGDAPVVSHLLYTQVLDDQIPEDRSLGIEAGLTWLPVAEATVVYVDHGITSGMEKGIARAQEEGRPVEYRHIQG